MDNEPAITIGSITALIGAAIVLARTFGVSITDDQERALTGLVAIAGPLVAGLVTRSFVLSRKTAQEKVQEAHESGRVGGPVPKVKA
jgi:hypothetical protein